MTRTTTLRRKEKAADKKLTSIAEASVNKGSTRSKGDAGTKPRKRPAAQRRCELSTIS